MRAAEDWLGARGMTAVRGPFNFSTNEECGFLVEGFDHPPFLMMPHTKPYYIEFMDRLGYGRCKDLFAYYYEYPGSIPEHIVRVSSRIQERTGVTVRMIRTDNFEESVKEAMQIYNAAWARNWGFVPMTDAEFRYMAHELKPIMDPAVALIAEKDGRPVGFSLSLPDYNILLRKMRGRLLPLGWLRFLLGRRAIDRVRIITLGVIQEYRNQAIDILLYYDTFRNGLRRGYRSCEMSWVLEDNVRMIRAIERMGGRRYKTYRIYEKAL
jgi:GNAT superfamily N-acetyltransferase